MIKRGYFFELDRRKFKVTDVYDLSGYEEVKKYLLDNSYLPFYYKAKIIATRFNSKHCYFLRRDNGEMVNVS